MSTNKRLRPPSACRPASVILTRATSMVRGPITTRSVVAVASPARTSSTSCSTVKPCASRTKLVTPSGQEASSSRARRRVLARRGVGLACGEPREKGARGIGQDRG